MGDLTIENWEKENLWTSPETETKKDETTVSKRQKQKAPGQATEGVEKKEEKKKPWLTASGETGEWSRDVAQGLDVAVCCRFEPGL